MKSIKIPTGEYLLVTIPEDATKFFIVNHDDLNVVWRDEIGHTGFAVIPPDQWEIIGRASELSEEDWEDILGNEIPMIDESEYNQDGLTITYTNKVRLTTYAESGLSLIKHHSMNAETTLLIIKIE